MLTSRAPHSPSGLIPLPSTRSPPQTLFPPPCLFFSPTYLPQPGSDLCVRVCQCVFPVLVADKEPPRKQSMCVSSHTGCVGCRSRPGLLAEWCWLVDQAPLCLSPPTPPSPLLPSVLLLSLPALSPPPPAAPPVSSSSNLLFFQAPGGWGGEEVQIPSPLGSTLVRCGASGDKSRDSREEGAPRPWENHLSTTSSAGRGEPALTWPPLELVGPSNTGPASAPPQQAGWARRPAVPKARVGQAAALRSRGLSLALAVTRGVARGAQCPLPPTSARTLAVPCPRRTPTPWPGGPPQRSSPGVRAVARATSAPRAAGGCCCCARCSASGGGGGSFHATGVSRLPAAGVCVQKPSRASPPLGSSPRARTPAPLPGAGSRPRGGGLARATPGPSARAARAGGERTKGSAARGRGRRGGREPEPGCGARSPRPRRPAGPRRLAGPGWKAADARPGPAQRCWWRCWGRGRAGAGLLSFQTTLETLTQSFFHGPKPRLTGVEGSKASPKMVGKKKMPVSLSTQDLEAKVVVVLSSS